MIKLQQFQQQLNYQIALPQNHKILFSTLSNEFLGGKNLEVRPKKNNYSTDYSHFIPTKLRITNKIQLILPSTCPTFPLSHLSSWHRPRLPSHPPFPLDR